jgi:hypothetical protein
MKIQDKSFVILDWHEQLNGRKWIRKFDEDNFLKAVQEFKDGNYDTTFIIVDSHRLESYLELQNKIGALKCEADIDHIRNYYWSHIKDDPKFEMAVQILEVWNDLGTMDPYKNQLIRKYEDEAKRYELMSFCDLNEIKDWLTEDYSHGENETVDRVLELLG